MSYTKQTWANGDIITAAKLNHMEDGIAAVDQKIDETVEELSTEYAKSDGSYEGMTVGNAEQLVATVGIEDSVPYTFRTSGGSADIGDRETDMLVGGTIAWNQLVNKPGIFAGVGGAGETAVKNSDASITVTYNPTSTGVAPTNWSGAKIDAQFAIDHVHLISAAIEPTFDTKVGFTGGGESQNNITCTANKKTYSAGIRKPTAALSGLGVYVKAWGKTLTDGDHVRISEWVIFDLTQMFGSTIADYIYSLEQANAGAGVAFFRKLFPKPYYEYNAGELLSVNASAHKTVGFNQIDKTKGVDGKKISTGYNGSELSDDRMWRSDFICVVPNANYYTNANGTGVEYPIVAYDANKNYIGRLGAANGGLFNTADANYVIIQTVKSLTPVDELVLNLSWDGERDGEYEPYVEHTYPLDSSLTLRGIPKLSADNTLYYDGDTYESDGTVTRKYVIKILNGTESWAGTPSNGWYTAANDMKKYSSYIGHMMADKLFAPYAGEGGIYGYNDAGNAYPAQNWIYYRNSSMERAADAKAYFAANPVAVIYELAEPTTETADTYQNPQIVDDFGTEEYIVTEQSGVAVPVGHETTYQANLRAKLEMAPDSPDGDGDYIVRQSNGQNSYVPITFHADELPAAPTTDGNYVLKCTVTNGTATFTWATA